MMDPTLSLDGLLQHCSISIADALEILQSCTKPLTWSVVSSSYLKSIVVCFQLLFIW